MIFIDIKLTITVSAEGVVANSRGIRSTIRFTSRLDPNDGIDELRTGVGRRASTETGTFDVAPVAPLLAEVLLAGTALVDDEGGGEPLVLEFGREGVDVVDFVVVLVALGDGVGGGGGEGVVVGDVWGKEGVRTLVESIDGKGGCGLLVARPLMKEDPPASLKT